MSDPAAELSAQQREEVKLRDELVRNCLLGSVSFMLRADVCQALRGAPMAVRDRVLAGAWCAKPVHPGWTPSEGHGGGHAWTSYNINQIMRGGHYDAVAALAEARVVGHLPEQCPGPDDCAAWPFLDRAKRDVVRRHLRGAR